MANVLEQIAQLNPSSAPDFLRPVQRSGRAALQAKAWPTRKTESWKYTSLRNVEQGDYFDAADQAIHYEHDAEALAPQFAIADFSAHRLVFVNGQFNAQLSTVEQLPAGVELVTFAQASGEQQAIINEHLGQVAPVEQGLFVAINSQLLADGIFLHVAKNVVLDKPLHAVWLLTETERGVQVAQRLLVVLEDHAQATVVEHFCSTDEQQKNLTHGVTELVLAEGAKCQHYRLHLEETHALHIGGVHVSLARNANIDSFHMALGSALKRVDVVVNHNGEGAHCELNGIYLPRQDEHVDYHTCIEHRVPLCTTSETFRGIVGDNGRAVFNGRIHIHPQAQKTLAQLSNKNLLTSHKAQVDTKPELEIYADDVQCAHGATVARLDETAMHYFRTRGISAKEAEVMLSFGFINELVNEMKLPVLADYLRPMLAHLFARDSKLARHIA